MHSEINDQCENTLLFEASKSQTQIYICKLAYIQVDKQSDNGRINEKHIFHSKTPHLKFTFIATLKLVKKYSLQISSNSKTLFPGFMTPNQRLKIK